MRTAITQQGFSHLSEPVQVLCNLTERICKEKMGGLRSKYYPALQMLGSGGQLY